MKAKPKPPWMSLTTDDYIKNCLLVIGEAAKEMSEEEKKGLHARLIELAKQFGIG